MTEVKYCNNTLNEALAAIQSGALENQKLGERFLRQAACLELGAKNTIPVREWFISNTDSLLDVIKNETDSNLLWGYVYMLQCFCGRYIDNWRLVQNSEDFANDKRTHYFKEQAITLVKAMITTEDLKVLQAVGSFLWLYGDCRAWDAFLKVLARKKDSLTLSHITLAVSQCHGVVVGGNKKLDYCGKVIDSGEAIISLNQAKALVERFLEIEKKSTTKKLACKTAAEQLKEILHVLSLK